MKEAFGPSEFYWQEVAEKTPQLRTWALSQEREDDSDVSIKIPEYGTESQGQLFPGLD